MHRLLVSSRNVRSIDSTQLRVLNSLFEYRINSIRITRFNNDVKSTNDVREILLLCTSLSQVRNFNFISINLKLLDFKMNSTIEKVIKMFEFVSCIEHYCVEIKVVFP